MVGGRDVGSATALHGETRLSLPHSPEASKSLATIRSFPFSLNDSPSRGPIFYEATPRCRRAIFKSRRALLLMPCIACVIP